MRIVKLLAIEELMDGELATNCTSRWDIPGCVSGIVVLVGLIQFKVGLQATEPSSADGSEANSEDLARDFRI